jgi:hypothetical protein
MERSRALPIAVLCAVAAASCGGAAVAPTAVASIGGDYATAVSLGQNGCGDVRVEPRTTRVDHAPGATTFRMTHGGISWSATLAPGGGFTTHTATVSDAASGTSSTLRAAGRFSASGFEADVTVAQQSGAGACSYAVHWTGTKSGAPNVLP